MEDLTGLVFSDLTAIRYVGSNNGQGSIWEWRCVCGALVSYPAHRIKRGHTLSCGCRRGRDCATIKLCRHCGKESRRKNRHGNFASVCQSCYNKQSNSFKSRNPAFNLMMCAKIRAKKKKLPFNLVEEDIVIPTHCPIFGIKLVPGNKRFHDASPSLDRIHPKHGYVRGNIIVISHRANQLKSNGSIEEFTTLLKWLNKIKAEEKQWEKDLGL